ncbi:TOTE conflict system archaeo-eukaryotic primase domain-containing protein [Paenibacillus sp. DYY-L-2]|uniref:TOTE conflict system archaeo-eukaryotic primase domain-containing protein n=1 Tax=Paenibacillus sp. DYY-L-2 TaxID=3447013 RepID=UPI003F4F80D3
MDIETKITLYKQLFIHRDDAYMSNTGLGWKPVRDCGIDRGFGDGQVLSHLEGRSRCGIYAMKPAPENTCKWVVADFDANDQAFTQAWSLAHYLKDNGLFPLVERSFSGKGYHVWLFFEQPIKARVARTLMFNALVETGIPVQGETGKGKTTARSFDRLFPAQDESRIYGNIIALPLFGEAVKQGNCTFVDDKGLPFINQWNVLSEAVEKRIPVIHPILQAERIKVEGIREERSSNKNDEDNSFVLLNKLPDQLNRIRDCEAIKQSISNPNAFNNATWTGVLSNIAVFESKGRDLAHEVSKGYDMRIVNQDPTHVYSEDETDRAFFRKVDYIQKQGIPASCRWLSDQGWTCPKLEYCPNKFIAMYGAPPSLTIYNPENVLTNDDRKRILAWEQTTGYEEVFRLFPDDAIFVVAKNGKLKEIRRKEYWLLSHLLGFQQVFVRYPGFQNTVRSIWYEWDSETDADRFEHYLLDNSDDSDFNRFDRSFWILNKGKDITLGTAMKVIEKLAKEAKIQLPETWMDVVVLKINKDDFFRPLPYFGELNKSIFGRGITNE